MKDNDRKEPRFVAHFDGFYRFKNTSEWHDCFISDISDSGANIRLNQSLIIGDQIEICLDVDHKDKVISGTVANVMGQSVGVKFSSKDADEIIDLAVKKAFNKARNKSSFPGKFNPS